MTFVTGVYKISYTCKFSGETIVLVGQISTTVYGGKNKDFLLPYQAPRHGDTKLWPVKFPAITRYGRVVFDQGFQSVSFPKP
jgi:hypothetical protein